MDFWTAFFANLPATILAAATFLGVVLNWLKTAKVAENVQKIESATNSMQEKMLGSAKAEGIALGKIEERANPLPRNPHLGGA